MAVPPRGMLRRRRIGSDSDYRQIQHDHPSIYIGGQQTLHVLRFPIHDPQAPIGPIHTCASLSDLWISRLPDALLPKLIISNHPQEERVFEEQL